MRVVIVGAGKVGFELAKRLSLESHDVTLIDGDAEALYEVSTRLDVMTMVGHGANPKVLQQAGVDEADLLVAVTDMDEVNMISCMVAKELGVGKCIARIRSPEYASATFHKLYKDRLRIDYVLDPEKLAALEIQRLLQMPFTTEIDVFANGRMMIAGFAMSPGAAYAGRPLSAIDLGDALVIALIRQDDVIIPTGNTVLREHDEIFVIGTQAALTRIRPFIDPRALKVEKLAIIGGGRIGYTLARLLRPEHGSGMKITLFEKNRRRAQLVAEMLPHVLVIEGDGTKIDVLRDESTHECHAFVAVSGEDHTNLLGTMLAHQLGIEELVTEVTREDYVPLARRAGAKAVVVPRQLAIGSVLRHVRTSNVVSITLLHEGKAEALELIAPSRGRWIEKPLRDIKFPRGAIVGAVVSEAGAEIARGDTVIRPGDRVIVFALPEVTHKIEREFRPSGKL